MMGTPSITSPRNSLLVSYLNPASAPTAASGPSTGALLTALNRAYKNGEPAIWLHNSSLIKFTRPDVDETTAEEQGPGVRELANRVWEHARRRAEDQIVVVRYAIIVIVVLIAVALLARERASRLTTS
jgi:hypothetical protein